MKDYTTYFTIGEIEKKIGVSRAVLYDCIRNGILHATNIGYGMKKPRWIVYEDDLKDFISLDKNKLFRMSEEIIIDDEPKKELPAERPKAFIKTKENVAQKKLDELQSRLKELNSEIMDIMLEIEELSNM